MGVIAMKNDLDRLIDRVRKLEKLVDEILGETLNAVNGGEADIDPKVEAAEQLKDAISREAILFIARYQPLGRELVTAENCIGISYDLYRIARYAREIITLNRVVGVLKDHLDPEAIDALRTARNMLDKSVEALARGDKELARSVEEDDAKIDELYIKYLEKLGTTMETIPKSEAITLLFLRHVERMADHATYIARKMLRTSG